MNFTLNGAYRNDNNLLRLRSTRLAEDYTAEFEEMFSGHHFGPDVGEDMPYPQVSLNGMTVEAWFSPDDHPLARLLDLVGQAQKQVLFPAFNFTDDALAARLVALHAQGIEVRGVFEAQQVAYSQGSEYRRLREAGLAVRLDGNPLHMHHKVFIVDGRWVVTGSYNFTRSAEERNDENLLILDSSALAALYTAEFERVWVLAHPVRMVQGGLVSQARDLRRRAAAFSLRRVRLTDSNSKFGGLGASRPRPAF
jgi:Phosphatidylserine/phosphatidylglycerophosphate/cardiolipin synthases and related enzymes